MAFLSVLVVIDIHLSTNSVGTLIQDCVNISERTIIWTTELYYKSESLEQI